MKFKFIGMAALIIATAVLFAACEKVENCHYDEVAKTLKCQGQTYSTVETGGRIWMAENANLVNFDSSYCYGNNLDNCKKYGRLYDWKSANDACPTGWELPKQADFEKVDFKLLNINKDGFRYYDGKFADENVSASFWTADAFDDSRAVMVRIQDKVTYEHYNKTIAASVRCVKVK